MQWRVANDEWRVVMTVTSDEKYRESWVIESSYSSEWKKRPYPKRKRSKSVDIERRRGGSVFTPQPTPGLAALAPPRRGFTQYSPLVTHHSPLFYSVPDAARPSRGSSRAS